jgi:hypothetical protein
VRAERTALHHSGARELAGQTLDRLPIAFHPKRFSRGESYEDHPKSKFHARGGPNSAGIAEARLTNPSNTRRLTEVISPITSDPQITQKLLDDNGCETINFIAVAR